MWAYEKKLQYPVKITNPNPQYAKIIISQLGGPDGELAAATRYLNQRYTMPYEATKGILTDIGSSVPILHRSKEDIKTDYIRTSSRYSPNYFIPFHNAVFPFCMYPVFRLSDIPFEALSAGLSSESLLYDREIQ